MKKIATLAALVLSLAAFAAPPVHHATHHPVMHKHMVHMKHKMHTMHKHMVHMKHKMHSMHTMHVHPGHHAMAPTHH